MGSQSAPTINYEVYTFNGQRWNLHARYDRNEREAALADARNVERTMKFCAKVVKETYFPTNNMSEESLVYAGDKSLRAAATERANAVYRGRGGGGGGGGGGGNGGGGDGKASLPGLQKKIAASGVVTSVGTFTRLLIVVAAAMTLAGTAAAGAKFFFESPGASPLVTPVTAVLLEYVTFVVVFLAAAYPLAVKMLDWRPSVGRRVPPARPVMAFRREPALSPPPEALDDDAETLDWDAVEDEDTPLPAIDDETMPLYDEPATQDDAKDTAAATGDSFDAIRLKFIQFLKDLMAEVRKIRPTLDAYNIFGVQLFLAGGVDCLGNDRGLNQSDRRELLRAAIDTLGGKPENSKIFAERYEEYLAEPKYMSMLQTGRNAMEMSLAGNEGAQEEIAKAFQQWNKPQKSAEQASPRIMTVVFTDMVGSTDLTQARGDQGAQHVVRRHNSIVRSALAQYSGKEIKHTGDGIMASFGSAANGVACCMVIQQQIADHNDKRPDQPLHVRIGINAGEPIEEEDDIFGSTVQLSARVCAKCETDEILVTNVVKELASGKGIEFESIGAQDLKGFKEPIPLFRVRWR